MTNAPQLAQRHGGRRLERFLRQRAKVPLAADFEDCLQLFTRLADIIQARRPNDDHVYSLADECMGRLKDWGEESGASSRCLDHVLKSSPMVKKQVLRLLKDLHACLDQAISSVKSRDELVDAVADFEKESSDLIEQKNNEVPDDQEEELNTEEYLDEALDILKCLTRLLPALWDPLEEEDDDDWSVPGGGLHSIRGYRQLAAWLFPYADAQLLDRLGECNWRRRLYLIRLRQKAKIAEHAHNALRWAGNKAFFSERSALRRGPLQEAFSSFQSSESWGGSDGANSSTAPSKGETLLSLWSGRNDQQSMTSLTETPNHPFLRELVPPDMPRPGPDMKPECSICSFELPLTMGEKENFEINEWTAHVYLDLQPYMCTFGKCNRDNRPFGNKRDWYQHEMDYHRSKVVFHCGACRLDFNEAHDWKEHVSKRHPTISPNNYDALLDNCQRYSEDVDMIPVCKLCGATCPDMQTLQHHLGNHLEIFALACIHDLDPVDDGPPVAHELLEDYLHGLQPGDAQISAGPGQMLSSIQRNPTMDDPFLVNGLMGGNGAMSHGELSNSEKVEKYLHTFEDPNPTMRHNVPDRDDNFVGRREDLDRIHIALSTPGRIFTISGPAGVGKTAIAVEHLYSDDREYSYVFWVEAELPGTCAERYDTIASCLDFGDKRLPEGASRSVVIRDQLARLDKRWLLIFDNVEKWADISRYIPRGLKTSKGSVLVTTRNGPRLEVQSYHHQATVSLDVWPLEHASEFLLTSIYPKLRRGNPKLHDDFEVAGRVVQKLGCLPLAISMTAGYVKVSKCELADFLEMWQEIESRRAPKMGQMAADDFDKVFAFLWEIGIREVQVNCRRILDIFSFFDPERIPKSLLVGDHEEEYLEDLIETLTYKRMINQLALRRLIAVKTLPSGEEVYSIHRLLKKMILDVMKGYERAQALRSAFRLLRKQYPRADPQQVPVPESRDICSKLMPHLSSFHQVFRSDIDLAMGADPKPVELAELFYDAGFYVWSNLTTDYDGLAFLDAADDILDRINFSQNTKLRADINCVAGLLLLNKSCDERGRSKERLQVARKARELVFEENPNEDNDILLRNASSDYCLTLMDDYEFDEAANLWEECIERYRKWGTEEDNPFEYSKYRGQISFIQMFQGNFEGAIENAEKCMSHIEKFAGKGPQYYRRVFSLACVLLQAGRLQDALDKHIEALNGRFEHLGKWDHATLQSTYAVGAMYHYIGDISTAIEYMKQAIECFKSVRPTKEATARCQYHLALLYEEAGQAEQEAEYLKMEARKVIEECRQFAAPCVCETDDEMMILDDLQATFQGRFTGRKLLPYVQEWQRKHGKSPGL